MASGNFKQYKDAPILPYYIYALAGASAGMANVLALHPFDTLKTRFQSSLSNTCGTQYSSTFQALYRIVKEEGFVALYKGITPALVGSTISWSLYFHSYHFFKDFLKKWKLTESIGMHWTCSTCAGIVTCLVTNPLWVIKTRLQLQIGNSTNRKAVPMYTNGSSYRGLFHGLVQIVHDEGLRGLYRGLGPSLLLVSHGAIQFTIYEQCKTWFLERNGDWKRQHQRTLDIKESLFASTISKVVASMSTYPLQVLRTRMQERTFALHRQSHSFLYLFWMITRKEGLKALYRGLVANLLRVTPSSAITFITYEQIVRLYYYYYYY
eukprot:jgi/Galph1/236/GphlegSOOS_G4985.1